MGSSACGAVKLSELVNHLTAGNVTMEAIGAIDALATFTFDNRIANLGAALVCEIFTIEADQGAVRLRTCSNACNWVGDTFSTNVGLRDEIFQL